MVQDSSLEPQQQDPTNHVYLGSAGFRRAGAVFALAGRYLSFLGAATLTLEHISLLIARLEVK